MSSGSSEKIDQVLLLRLCDTRFFFTVANVTFPMDLLLVVILVWHQRRNVEHDLKIEPGRCKRSLAGFASYTYQTRAELNVNYSI